MVDAFTPRKLHCHQSLHKQASQEKHLIHEYVLDVVDCNKYLGVNISEDLSWKKQTDYTAAKASRTKGSIEIVAKKVSHLPKAPWFSVHNQQYRVCTSSPSS